MFDPTIFDNIKVVLEGEIYDLDLAGEITINNRNDWVDLARMSREYRIQFCLVENNKKTAECILSADTKDLSSEILELKSQTKPGCELSICFEVQVEDPGIECKMIEEKLNQIWSHRPTITQTIQFNYLEPLRMRNKVLLQFGRKIDEDNIQDIPNLIEYTIKSLRDI